MLNPAQQRFIAALRRAEPPEFDDDVGERLHAELEDALGPYSDELDPADPLYISKHSLATIHGCEAHFVATTDTFDWSIANARGTVVHKAIQLMVHWRGEPTVFELVDEAIARCTESERGLASFLQGLREADRAELRSAVNDLVAKFRESIPPLKREWIPVTESRSIFELLGGRVVLSGKTDLTLGDPNKGEKVIIDLKTGRPVIGHREDLRFYALVETLKLGRPPRALATYYLDAAQAHREDVTTPLLQSAARRTVDGAVKMIELLREGREPKRTPVTACRWCPLLRTCDEGQADAAAAAVDDD